MSQRLSPRRRHPPGMVIAPWPGSDGWALRSFRLAAEAPAKGEILFLGGRGDFFEKYLESFELWQSAGWNVSGFDWRGQGGSGRTHQGNSCHIEDFADFVGDLEAWCSEWATRTEAPRVAIGHSMGGHVLLRAALEGRVKLDGIVLLSPMLGIRAGPLGARSVHGIATIGRAAPLRERPLWRGAKSPVPGRITSCPERQADKLWWKSARPDLARDGPTWGWVAAATRSIARLQSDLRERQLTTPGLILAAAGDPIVDPNAIDRAARLLPSFDYAVIEDAGHELLRERDGLREESERRIADFLERLA